MKRKKKNKRLTFGAISRGVHFNGHSSLGLKRRGPGSANESSKIVLENSISPQNYNEHNLE